MDFLLTGSADMFFKRHLGGIRENLSVHPGINESIPQITAAALFNIVTILQCEENVKKKLKKYPQGRQIIQIHH